MNEWLLEESTPSSRLGKANCLECGLLFQPACSALATVSLRSLPTRLLEAPTTHAHRGEGAPGIGGNGGHGDASVRLTTEQSYSLLERFGCYVKDVCDKCGQLLGPVRSTRCGEPEEWCSRECRGDAERQRPVRGLVQRKHAALEERLAGRRAKAAARQERLRLRKVALFKSA